MECQHRVRMVQTSDLQADSTTMPEWVRTDTSRMASTTASNGFYDAGGTVLLLSSTCSTMEGGVQRK